MIFRLSSGANRNNDDKEYGVIVTHGVGRETILDHTNGKLNVLDTVIISIEGICRVEGLPTLTGAGHETVVALPVFLTWEGIFLLG